MTRTGAVTAAMIDAAIPPRCMAEARTEVAKRTGAWIHRATVIIQDHNDSIEQEGNHRRCRKCGSDSPLLWDSP